MPFTSLPPEVHLIVLRNLDPTSFLQLSQTNRRCRELRKVSESQCWDIYRNLEKNVRNHSHYAFIRPYPLPCYLCFELLDCHDPKQHYWISRRSKFFVSQDRFAERLCVRCDKSTNGVHLSKLLKERDSSGDPRATIAILLQDHHEEVWRLRSLPGVLRYLLRYGPTPRGKARLGWGDVNKWSRSRFKSEMKKLVARG